MELQFGTWLPDGQDYKNPGLEECKNVVPGVNGYRPARAPISTGVSVSGTIIGATSVFLKDGSTIVCVATTSDIHVIRSGAITASSLSLGLSALDIVDFEQYGTAVYASTKSGGAWYLSDIEVVDTFATWPGSPPSANAIGRVGDFLLMGDLNDIDASDSPYRIRWSRFNDPQGNWGTDIAAQSGAVDLDAAYGPVTAIKGRTVGLILQRQGVSRLTYTGGASVFRLDTFEKNRGCVAPASAVQVGEQTYFLSYDGFYVTSGTTPVAISTGRIWQWFVQNCNQTFLKYVVGAVDHERRCVVWLFPAGRNQTLTAQIWFHWDTQQWSYVDQALEWAVDSAKDGRTLEQVATDNPDLDVMSLSLDSPEFLAVGRTLQVFSGGALSGLTGTPLTATLTGGDVQPFTGRRMFVRGVTPLVEGGDISIRLGARGKMSDAITVTDLTPVGPIGFAPFNTDARYFRVTHEISGDWDNAYGYQIDGARGGGL